MKRPWKPQTISWLRQRMITFLKAHSVVFNATGKERDLRTACAAILAIDLPQQRAKARDVLSAALPTEPTVTSAVRVAPRRRDFYESEAWRRLRYQVLLKNNGHCECCGASSASGAQLHVDHVKPRSKFPELELDITNLQVLCRDCNLGKGAWDETDWREAAQ